MSCELPSSAAIIGAGPIGIEFAYLLVNYGVAVTVIESLQRVLPNEDVDVAKRSPRPTATSASPSWSVRASRG